MTTKQKDSEKTEQKALLTQVSEIAELIETNAGKGSIKVSKEEYDTQAVQSFSTRGYQVNELDKDTYEIKW